MDVWDWGEVIGSWEPRGGLGCDGVGLVVSGMDGGPGRGLLLLAGARRLGQLLQSLIDGGLLEADELA
jgi:hypothetical protein